MTRISNSVVTLQPGMYLLRHPGQGLAPLTIGRAPGNRVDGGSVQRLGTPGTDGEMLRTAADCIAVVVSGGPVELLISAFLAQHGDTVPQLRVDRVALDDAQRAAAAKAPPQPTAAAAVAPAAPASKAIRIKPQGISLIGHLGAGGDVVAAEGELLGDGANGRVEGFQAMWPDRPQGVDLAYRITVEGSGPSETVKTGKFVGTRGKGHRITEVGFVLVGPEAARYRLEGDAHFSGGFVVPVASGVSLSGPSGMEHLTALSLRAKPVAAVKNSVLPKTAPLNGTSDGRRKRG